jgi:hypothetical protein
MATPTPRPTPNDSGPTQASRVRGFATFFKSYMSIWTLVVAALPIPVGAFKLIPTFEAQRSYLSVYTSLFCFLSLGYIFFRRHRLGYYMFPPQMDWKGVSVRRFTFDTARAIANFLPLACIVLSVFAVFRYHSVFNDAILIAQAEATTEKQGGTLPSAFRLELEAGWSPLYRVPFANHALLENSITVAALAGKTGDDLKAVTIDEAAEKAKRYSVETENWGRVSDVARAYLSRRDRTFFLAQEFIGNGVKEVPSQDEALKRKLVPRSTELMLWYLTIFVAAETAFILMALKEYLQDLAHISDLSLMGIGHSGIRPEKISHASAR